MERCSKNYYSIVQRAIKMNQQKNQKESVPPRYDEAFKSGAVKMVTEQGWEPKEVARDLGQQHIRELEA